MIDKYCSSPERLASWFKESRDNWKKRQLRSQKELRKANIKIRDLVKSRENWKAKAKKYQGQIKQLEEEKKLLQKKGKYQ